ncbi:adenosine deaminase 2-like [Amphibalanus amphitrite]|uniref:adenosine deaminase 2-like n=1 Tax=Amphibalanus amphitrite TaxID=1232801 RepID=UPI001C8FDB38|nr:adenosine deaminase 2-like [Amphibalanus amphitrite]
MRWWLSLGCLWSCFLLLLALISYHFYQSCGSPQTTQLWSTLANSHTQARDNLSDYWSSRSKLLTADQLLETGGTVVLHGAEQQVNDLLTVFKREEYKETPFEAGRHFMNAREDIEKSNVFELIRMMPKGSMLHIHDISMLSVEKLVSNVTYMDHLYLCNSTQSSGEPDVRLQFFAAPDMSCDWLLLSDVRASLGAGPVDKWLIRQLSMIVERPDDVYEDLHSSWAAFDGVISRVRGMIHYEPAWRRVISLALQEMADDNIQYAEIRSSLPQLSDLSGNLYPASHTIDIYRAALLEAASSDQGNRFWGGRVILAMSRHVSPEQVSADVDRVLQLHADQPDLVAGFDLVAEEDCGAPLKEFVPQLLRLAENGVQTFYHAGETYWLGTDVDENLYDAILLNASRIGHGYGIVKHPLLMREAARRGVAMEVCPISNQVLGLVSDLRNHPAAVLLASGLPVVVSADDPGAWGAAGLSYDFYLTLMALAGRRADLSTLKELAINSIRYSSLPDAEKQQLGMEWNKRWDEFIDQVVDKYQLRT